MWTSHATYFNIYSISNQQMKRGPDLTIIQRSYSPACSLVSCLIIWADFIKPHGKESTKQGTLYKVSTVFRSFFRAARSNVGRLARSNHHSTQLLARLQSCVLFDYLGRFHQAARKRQHKTRDTLQSVHCFPQFFPCGSVKCWPLGPI